MSSSLSHIAPALIDTKIAESWGNIPHVPWIQVTSKFQDLEGVCTISLQISVSPHEVTCPLWRGDRTVHREGGEVISRESFSYSPHALSLIDLRKMIQVSTGQAIRTASPLLREVDPRFGTIVKANTMKSFPRGILFDPPRMRPPTWEQPPMDSVTCAFCNSGFGAGAPAMWAGGNLLWTHPACWIRAYDEE